MSNGWIGDAKTLKGALEMAKADRDDAGKFIVSGMITSFMSAGDEFVVDSDARYMKDGKWENLCDLLRMAGGGVSGVAIF